MDSSLVSPVLRGGVLIASLFLYFFACLLRGATGLQESGEPCFDSSVNGLGLLVLGWVGGPQLWLPWLSNFVCLTAAVLLGFGRSAAAFVASGGGLALASLAYLPQQEAIFHEARECWLTNFAVLTTSCAIAAVLDRLGFGKKAGLVRQAVRPLADSPGVSARRARQPSEGIVPDDNRRRIEGG